jgi:arylsulfatase A-like enzyme
MDRSVAAFLRELKRRGLWENTLIIVTGDHGEMLGERGLLGHTERLYEPVLRVPLFVRHPRLRSSRGARVRALVERTDLAATLVDAAGAPDPRLPGSSLLPLLRDPAAPWRRHAYASSQRSSAAAAPRFIGERALTDGRWKLHWYADRPGFELYDLLADPGETRDLAAERPAETARLAFELQRQAEAARRAGEPAALLASPTGE